MAKHRSARQWATLLESYRGSWLSQAEFCRRKGLSLSSFGYQLRRDRSLGGAAGGAVPQLLEVAVPSSGVSGRDHGVRIEVPTAQDRIVSIRCACGQVGEILRQIPGLVSP